MEKINNNISVKTINVVLCDILGYSDKCFVLKEISDFTKAIDDNSKKVLLEYQELDCLLALNIKKKYETDHNKDLWIQFYKLFLSTLATLIVSCQYDEAILKYQQMMDELNNYFNEENYTNINYQKKLAC